MTEILGGSPGRAAGVDRVLLGIAAPREGRVVRSEFLRAVEAEVQESSAARATILAALTEA